MRVPSAGRVRSLSSFGARYRAASRVAPWPAQPPGDASVIPWRRRPRWPCPSNRVAPVRRDDSPPGRRDAKRGVHPGAQAARRRCRSTRAGSPNTSTATSASRQRQPETRDDEAEADKGRRPTGGARSAQRRELRLARQAPQGRPGAPTAWQVRSHELAHDGEVASSDRNLVGPLSIRAPMGYFVRRAYKLSENAGTR